MSAEQFESGESVICLTKQPKIALSNQDLIEAQQMAMAHKLPLCVIYVVQKDLFLSQKVSLLAAEEALKQHKIPLLVLLGDAAKVLPALYHHLRPQKIFVSEDQRSSQTIVDHPYDWPGTIISVERLANLVSSGAEIC